MFSETKSRENQDSQDLTLSVYCLVSWEFWHFIIVRTHCILNWNSLIHDWDSWFLMKWVPGLTIQGSKLKKMKLHFFDQLTGVSLSIRDRRILRLPHIILWLNFNEVWLFFIQKNQMCICHANVKRNYSQKCIILEMHKWQ